MLADEDRLGRDPSQRGDLREVEALARKFAAGDGAAGERLQAFGGQASFTVMKVADELNHSDLREFGRRLVAVRGELTTNLYELRFDSVSALVRRHSERAILATHLRMEAQASVALFDPMRVATFLVRGGRPRQDLQSVRAGDIAWFGLPRRPMRIKMTTLSASRDKTEIVLARGKLLDESDAAGPREGLQLALNVESGVVFVGPPEAADGPRWGALRLDPFHTGLDAFETKGQFVRLKPGSYVVDVRPDGHNGVTVCLSSGSLEDPERLSLELLDGFAATLDVAEPAE